MSQKNCKKKVPHYYFCSKWFLLFLAQKMLVKKYNFLLTQCFVVVTFDLCGLLNLSQIVFNPSILNKEKYLFVPCSTFFRRSYWHGHRTRYFTLPNTRVPKTEAKKQNKKQKKHKPDSFGQSVSYIFLCYCIFLCFLWLQTRSLLIAVYS